MSILRFIPHSRRLWREPHAPCVRFTRLWSSRLFHFRGKPRHCCRGTTDAQSHPFGGSEAREFGGDAPAGFDLAANSKTGMLRTMIPASDKQTPAFTRLELLACLAAATLLVTIIVPALATSGSRSDRVVCFNNLRQIGVAYGQFGLEHGEFTPWRVTMAEGGSIDHPAKSNPGIQFSVLSNGVATPKVLSDPADTRPAVRPATHWGTSPGGLLNPGFRNNAVSYFLGVDGNFTLPRRVLAGDRNVRAQAGVGCSSGIVPVAQVLRPVTWTNDVHGLAGNVVFFDGSAEQVDSGGLSDALGVQDDVAGGSANTHLLIP